MSWADCQLEMLSFQVSKLAYDIALDIIDAPDGDCVAMLIVRKDLYSQEEAQYLIQSYDRLVNAFVIDLSMPLDEPEIFSASDIEKAIGFGRGASIYSALILVKWANICSQVLLDDEYGPRLWSTELTTSFTNGRIK